jgi:hypothetical protein
MTDVAVIGFASSTDQTTAVVAVDSDGDGWMDLLVGNSGEQNRVYYGAGDGTFKNPPGAILSDLADTKALLSGDFDNDGHLDVVAGNQSRILSP